MLGLCILNLKIKTMMNYKSFLDTINAIGPIGDAAMDLSPQKKNSKQKV